MTDFGPPGLTRRHYLRALGGTGLMATAAGCGSTGDEANPTATDTVVFTDSDTPVTSPTPDETSTPAAQVFDGGDSESFVAAVEAAAEVSGVLQVEPGTYRLDPLDRESHLRLWGLSDLTIEGNGATVVFTDPSKGGVQFVNCDGVVVRNLEFDYDPLPFTQGEIVDISEVNRTITLQLDEGYPQLSHEMFDTAAIVFATTHRPDGAFVSGVQDTGSPDKFFSRFEQIGGRTYRLHLRERTSFVGIEAGNRLTVVARNNKATVSGYQVDEPTFEGVAVRTSNGAAFAMQVCEQPTFQNCSVVRPPDSDRQLAAVADGIRITNCIGGSTIEGCRHERLGDDGIAVTNRMVRVQAIESDRKISVNQVHPFVVREGDVLEAMSPGGTLRGELPPIERYDTGSSPVGDRGKPRTITFTEPISDQLVVGDYVGNTATASSNYEIRNNELRSHRARLIQANSRDGLIEGNVLEGSNEHVIELRSGTKGFWPPKRWLSNVTIRDNELRGAGLRYIAGSETAAIKLHHETPPNTATTGRPNQNVVIENNTIEETGSVGVDAEAARDLRIEGNTMSGLNRLNLPDGGYGVRLSDVQDAGVTDNDIIEPIGDAFTAFGHRQQCESLAVSGNTVSIDGDRRAGEFVQFVPVTFTFNRTVVPDGGNRQLTFLCYWLELVDGDGSVVRRVNLGDDESGVAFGEGVDDPEHHDGATWRWFGPDESTSVLYFFGDELARPTTMRLHGYAIEGGISATIRVDGTVTDDISWSDSRTRTYEVSLDS